MLAFPRDILYPYNLPTKFKAKASSALQGIVLNFVGIGQQFLWQYDEKIAVSLPVLFAGQKAATFTGKAY